MNMDTSRNTTFDRVLEGKYSNIRMLSVPHNNQPDTSVMGFDFDILPPPPAQNAYGGDAGGGWLLPSVGTYANATCRAGLGDHCSDPSMCCTGYPQVQSAIIFVWRDTCWPLVLCVCLSLTHHMYTITLHDA